MITRLIKEAPKFHRDGEDDWGTYPELLHFLNQVCYPNLKTIETGAGKSTVVFAGASTDHLVITPAAGEVDRIRAYCSTHDVSLSRVTFLVERSEIALPKLRDPCDLALIDGSHAFPYPIVDFFYLSRLLRKNGILIVDDVGLWPCGILAEFLRGSEEWTLSHRFAHARAMVFTKTTETLTHEWMRQQFVARRARPPIWRRAIHQFFPAQWRRAIRQFLTSKGS